MGPGKTMHDLGLGGKKWVIFSVGSQNQGCQIFFVNATYPNGKK
jgi:hypothetical protein